MRIHITVCCGFIQLARMGLSAAVAFSAFAGFVCTRRHLSPDALILFGALFLLAGAASACNQCQEVSFDTRMARTRRRPLPSGIIAVRRALLFAVALGTLGIIGLFRLGGLPSALLGAGGLALYCGLYTPLKQRSRWAFFVGALAGAIPPVIGCIAAGATPLPNMLAMGLFMYLWQIPHFVMVLLKHRQDYLQAGFPFVSIHSRRLRLLAAAGVGATAMSTALFPALGLVDNRGAITILLPCGIGIVACFLPLSRAVAGHHTPTPAKLSLYAYQACVLGALIVSALGTPM